jgi:hypothetical protein
MKNLIPLLLVFILVSCEAENVEKVENETVETKKEVKASIEKKVSIGEFSNPAIIYGTDFLSFFKSLKKLGQYNKMLDFTCSESVKKYGKEELLKFYKNDFVNMSNSSLKNMEKLDNDTYVMYYLNSEFATKKAFEIKVKVENDSTKLFFENKYPF